ncbi:MAG: response regulator [Pyrinomonadaceae bacterium]
MSAEKILVVEDEGIIAKDIQSSLRGLGYDVPCVVSSGEEAVAKVAEIEPDLVLMDIMLKGALSGINAAQLIRDRFGIPVIYLTAYADNSTLERAKVTEPFGYIIKPFEERELQTTIEMALYRHQMEKRLRESEQRFATTLKSIGDAVIATDQDGLITFMNPVAENLTGWKQEEACGENLTQVFNIINERTRVRMETPLAKVLQEEMVVGTVDDSCVIARDGMETSVESNAAPIRDKKGNVTGVVLVFRDTVKRRQAEDAIRWADQRAINEYEHLLERIEHLAQTLGTARDLITVFRALLDFAQLSTPCTGLFVSLYHPERNARTAVYAWSEGEEVDVSELPPMAMSDSPHSRAVSTNQVIITDDFQAAIANQKTVIYVGVERDPRLPQSSLAVPMSVMGRIVGAIELQSVQPAAFGQQHATAMRMAANLAANAIENVQLFEREREREEQLRQSQKLEAVGQLAGGIAHDFNNLLVVITGYSDLLLRRMPPEDSLRSKVQEIKKAGDRAASLTHQLLAFSRKQVLQPKVLDLNTVVSSIGKMLQRLIGEHIELVLSLKPAVGQVKADPGQIEQVIINLAVNARDAMSQGGRLLIETCNVELKEEYAGQRLAAQPGFYVLLSVSDTGCGIDPQTQARIFEPFFTTKEVGKGTGLGLSTVYGIVKQSGGNVTVSSEPTRGTTFKLFFPRIAEEASVLQQPSESEELPQGTETVLLVEDEPLVRKMAREILELSGYTVLDAANGSDALLVCERYDEPIHLVLTDVVMPQMGGRELADELAHRHPEIKVLYMSGYTDDAIVHHGVLNENTAFLEKPFKPNALARKVRETLDAPQKQPQKI